jgi:elongation factor 3
MAALSSEIGTCLSKVGEKITDKSAAEEALAKLVNFAKQGIAAAPFLVKGLPGLLTTTSNKEKKIASAACEVVEAVIANLNQYAVRLVAPILIASLGNKKKPEEKICALKMLAMIAVAFPQETSWCLVDALPPALEQLTDIKKDVQAAALDTCTKLAFTAGNKDVEPFVPEMMKAIMKPATIGDVVEKLASVVFVQAVETPALAVTVPVVFRGLKDKKEPTKRKASVIINNMVNLVPDPREVLPFLDVLLPVLKRAADEISDPEARGVAEKAHGTLTRAQETTEVRSADPEAVKAAIKDPVGENCRYDDIADITAYLTGVSCGLTTYRNFDKAVWTKVFSDFNVPADVAESTCDLCFKSANSIQADEVEEEEGQDLCNCVFTLGYGSLTLLNNTRLYLKRGGNYGLLGPNDCGKTTLMRAINNEQVEGFPPKSELKTAFVEHGIGEAEPECDWSPFDYLLDEPVIKAMFDKGETNMEKMEEELKAVGFKRGDKLDMTLGQLSGGWKMKMGLARAKMMDADILMMDEPTGHLDKFNIAWLIDYVNSLKKREKPVTVIAVSHDTEYLEKTTTHILEFENRKLSLFRGNIKEFVKKKPEAKIYFEITTSAKVKFVFPDPGPLEGVKSRGKALLRMSEVHFQYPGTPKPQLYGVGVHVSMLSRVAIVGPNGAGKSTMIKCLLGELRPTTGNIMKVTGSRVAYMSQHAFHHIESHLDISATAYIMQRFAGGEDNESLENLANLGATKENENQKVKRMLYKDGNLEECDTFYNDKGELDYQKKSLDKAVDLEAIATRRKGKKEHEYECKWKGYSIDFLTWVGRAMLYEMGYKVQVQREDEKQAAMAGLQNKQLTTPGVEKHLADFGVPAEFATHNNLRALSAGQKVKIVLGAAMWQNPHILVIDEPTNYLDRDALGALTEAIKNWLGGVVVISHNLAFCDQVATEKWIMDAGHLRAEGGEYVDVKLEDKGGDDTITDASGNVIDVKRNKTLDPKEIKKAIKDVEKKLKEAKKKKLTDEELWALEDKLNELKEQLSKD